MERKVLIALYRGDAGASVEVTLPSGRELRLVLDGELGPHAESVALYGELRRLLRDGVTLHLNVYDQNSSLLERSSDDSHGNPPADA